MYRHAKRVVITVLGTSVLLVGVAMIVLPGPAFIVIPAGLAILATEFVWAKRLLDRLKREANAIWYTTPVDPPGAEPRHQQPSATDRNTD